mmetsp:Transcript_5821/g.8193  ORF Transcript_5821/g.8193 Transcript_5821/m.8193 type:complete len:201 (-) Transcript_5821:1083-1685(-)
MAYYASSGFEVVRQNGAVATHRMDQIGRLFVDKHLGHSFAVFGVLGDQLSITELPDPHSTIPASGSEVLQCRIVVDGDGQGAVPVGAGQQPLDLVAQRVRTADGAVLPARQDHGRVQQRQTKHCTRLGTAESGQTCVIGQVPGAYLSRYATSDKVGAVGSGSTAIGGSKCDAGDPGGVAESNRGGTGGEGIHQTAVDGAR